MLSFPPHPQTRNKLLKLLNGDQEVCQRLITNIKSQYPEMNEQCCYDKVIADLVRDRR